jgi:hypothetical protein
MWQRCTGEVIAAAPWLIFWPVGANHFNFSLMVPLHGSLRLNLW